MQGVLSQFGNSSSAPAQQPWHRAHTQDAEDEGTEAQTSQGTAGLLRALGKQFCKRNEVEQSSEGQGKFTCGKVSLSPPEEV